jgi:putative copper resistance protein D
MMPTAAFHWSLSQWNISLFPTVILLALACAYILAAKTQADWSRLRTLSFCGGLAVTFLATQSILGLYDMSYFSVHMIEHLMLVMVAAPLFAASAPLDLAWRVGGERVKHFLDGRAMSVITNPLFGLGQYAVVIVTTHLTGFLNLMLTHMAVHHAEQVLFLVSGYLFFRAGFGLERGRTLHPGLRLVFVMVGVPVDTITGLAIVMTTHIPAPALLGNAPAGATRAWVLSNFHLGGAIMWIGGDALMLLACIPIAVHWVRYETRRTKEVDRELDALGL